MADFDVEGARKAGYSDAEIADHLAGQVNFDAPAARKAGYSDAEIIAHVRPAVSSFNAKPTDRQELLSSAPMRLAKGGKDPIDGLAQLAQRAVDFGVELVSPTARLQAKLGGKRASDYINQAADAVGGEGTFLGDVAGVRGMTREQLDNDIKSSNAEYEAARKATAPETLSSTITGKKDPGVDLMRLTGNVISPANVIAARVAPVPGISGPARAIATKGAVAGAVGAAAQPVMGDNFAADKALQVGTGAAAGAVLAPLAAKVAETAGRVVDAIRRRGNTVAVTPDAIRAQVRAALQADGIDVASIPDTMMSKLADDATTAVKSGKVLDATAALRAQDFKALGLPYTRGQVTRDPAQWQREFNIAGIEGAGDPLRAVLQGQSQGIGRRFQQGAAGAGESFDDANTLMTQLRGANDVAEGNVRAAYKAFKNSTGKELNVPLQGLAQDYANALRTFGIAGKGGAIPKPVADQFEELGLLSGKQLKSLSIDDAENLIRTINQNTNPADRANSGALGALRASLQKAITSAADADPGAGAEAASLASEARALAAGRFKTVEQTPALRAAIDNAEPDDFIKKFVIGGKVNEIDRMMSLLGSDGQDKVRAQTIKYLQGKAFGANAAGDGKAAQATFNAELNRIGRNKLVSLLGEQGADDMQRVGRVLAYIKQAPEGATPNTSGTSQALLSALGKAKGIKGLPYIKDFVVDPIQGFADRRAATNALQDVLTQRADLDPATVRALSLLMEPVPVAGGVAAGQAIR